MPRLMRLTIAAKEPSRLAAFYMEAFNLKTVEEGEEGIFLSDGAFSMALLPLLSGEPRGFYAIGFHVEDMTSIQRRLAKSEMKEVQPERRLSGESLIGDPDGNLVGLSEKGFRLADQKTVPPIHHIALYTPNPKRLADFYTGVLEMREVGRTDRSSIFVSDGNINLALLYQRADENLGFNHFGFHVVSNDEIRRRATQAGVAPGQRRPDRIPYAEFRVHDPEGNGIDVSQKGWDL